MVARQVTNIPTSNAHLLYQPNNSKVTKTELQELLLIELAGEISHLLKSALYSFTMLCIVMTIINGKYPRNMKHERY